MGSTRKTPGGHFSETQADDGSTRPLKVENVRDRSGCSKKTHRALTTEEEKVWIERKSPFKVKKLIHMNSSQASQHATLKFIVGRGQ